MAYPEDSRHPAILYCPLDDKDRIDFPCSDLWLNYYHDIGLTPRKADEPPPVEPVNVLALIDDVNKLRTECGNLRREVFRLQKMAPKPPKEEAKGFKPIAQSKG